MSSLKRRQQERGGGKRNIALDFACNNPDNGIFNGNVEMIQIGDLELEARRRARPPTLTFPKIDTLRLSGKCWPYISTRSGGNWCWNTFLVTMPTAVDFLIWLRGRKLYEATCGPERLFDWFNNPAIDLPSPVIQIELESS